MSCLDSHKRPNFNMVGVTVFGMCMPMKESFFFDVDSDDSFIFTYLRSLPIVPVVVACISTHIEAIVVGAAMSWHTSY